MKDQFKFPKPACIRRTDSFSYR